MTRPTLLLGVCGTTTEIGKTWVAARLATELSRRDLVVRARKPAQSFEPGDLHPTDAEVLAAATGDVPEAVCPRSRWYPAALAPPMAAACLGSVVPTLADLLGETTWPAGVDVGIAETVGGVRSPIADDGDSRDFVHALGVDHVVLVADAGLGTIDAVRSAVGGLVPHPVAVFLNRFDPMSQLHRLNRDWLDERDGFAVTTTLGELEALLVPGDGRRHRPELSRRPAR